MTDAPTQIEDCLRRTARRRLKPYLALVSSATVSADPN
jgi:hypothetical protein